MVYIDVSNGRESARSITYSLDCVHLGNSDLEFRLCPSTGRSGSAAIQHLDAGSGCRGDADVRKLHVPIRSSGSHLQVTIVLLCLNQISEWVGTSARKFGLVGCQARCGNDGK